MDEDEVLFARIVDEWLQVHLLLRRWYRCLLLPVCVEATLSREHIDLLVVVVILRQRFIEVLERAGVR